MQDPRDLIAESLPIMGKGTVTWRELQHSADLIIKRLQLEGWTIVRASGGRLPGEPDPDNYGSRAEA